MRFAEGRTKRRNEEEEAWENNLQTQIGRGGFGILRRGKLRAVFPWGTPTMTPPSLFCIPTGKWPFKQRRPKLGFSCGSLADPERHCMSLPLLQSIAAGESDTEE